ncbi:MAG: nucleotidyltransferase family protein [Ectothiorhodospiraceae bacterium]|nr:nucleotidyltransferase family protein [Ectothiorhodospiraceae bacterium]
MLGPALIGAPCSPPAPEALGQVAAAARAHDMDLALHAALGPGPWWPPAVGRDLAARARAAAAASEWRDDAARRAIDTLAAAGIDCLVLKGGALAHQLYPEPWTRVRHDTDLLVRPQDAQSARRALAAAGFAPAAGITGELVSHQTLCLHRDRRGMRHAIDLHWRISNRARYAGVADLDGLLAAAVPVPALGPHARAPGLADALVLACVHRLGHHPGEPSLGWLLDVHLLAHRLGPLGIASALVTAAAADVEAPCLAGLEAARRALGTPLEHLPDRPWPVARATAALDRLDRGGSQIETVLDDLRALPGWRDRLRLLREHLAPSAGYLRASMPAHAHRSVLALALRRVARGLGRAVSSHLHRGR